MVWKYPGLTQLMSTVLFSLGSCPSIQISLLDPLPLRGTCVVSAAASTPGRTTLTAQGLQIVSAHVSTYGERVVDVFYVKDVFGLKVEQAQKLQLSKVQIRNEDAAGAEAGVDT